MSNKKFSIKKFVPRGIHVIVKAPSEAYETSKGEIIKDLKSKDVRIKEWVANGNPMEIVSFGPDLDDLKVGSFALMGNHALQSNISDQVEEDGYFLMCRQHDILCIVEK